jgi:hypothetical protein
LSSIPEHHMFWKNRHPHRILLSYSSFEGQIFITRQLIQTHVNVTQRGQYFGNCQICTYNLKLRLIKKCLSLITFYTWMNYVKPVFQTAKWQILNWFWCLQTWYPSTS